MAPRDSKEMMQRAAEFAIRSIGLGYDVASDIRLKFCKQRGSPDPSLIELDRDGTQDIVLPGSLTTVAGVPKSIKCDKGERMRFRSDVLSFQQMSEQFNRELSLSGKIPSGQFNCMFEFTGSWQKDAASTKSLAFDGWCITLYNVALSKAQIVLQDHVKQAVPSTWEPAALARFIEKFGTHIVVGVKMGGKDVIYLKQQYSSSLQAVDVQKRLKEMSDRRFLDANGQSDISFRDVYRKEDKSDRREQRLIFVESSPLNSYASEEVLVMMPKRRGGRDEDMISHSEWLNSIQAEPDVISMSFVPITSLLNGVPDKPPIEELHQFLAFQLTRQWAPVYSDLPLGPQRKTQISASLPVNFIGPTLYVCTNMVDVGKRPITGLRLFLEGKKSNKLAIHLQHLCSLPRVIQLENDPNNSRTPEPFDHRYFEPIGSWKHFSHVCTMPVESEDASIVTGAQLEVINQGFKKILFLRLHFSKVVNAYPVRRQPEWEGSPNLIQKSGLISTLISTHFSTAGQKPMPRPSDVNINSDANINSAVYPSGPLALVQPPKLLKFVDRTEMARGPQDLPGYWVVSAAKLHLERGKISLRVRYSLVTSLLPGDEEYALNEEF
ncbi:MACPF domain-containing protein At4g24290-like isoform X2 [Triticum dicoccoides]|uniref:MACPF domain-containing protein At4g24290-like isoform X2 n=1 Tax=Triticum dicoccoides TaxID=85692 RepID=UPI000E7ACC0D|nr:MACPF domain-containing protein At4g24290-like isoform X2 [Triticum dicoccoides]